MGTNYTLKHLHIKKRPLGNEIEFIQTVADKLNDTYGRKFRWRKFDVETYFKTGGRFVLCLRDEEPVGLMLSKLFTSVWDPEVRILRQDLFYAQPGTRAAKYLFDDFIDFGKASADHLIVMETPHTNFKPEKRGFVYLEKLYRLET